MGFFILDGTASTDFGVGLSGTGSWTTPQREIEKTKIPGRSGQLITYVGGWENIELTYPAWMARRFNEKWDKFAEWWNAHTDNYYELSDTYHPEYFRLACPVSKLSPTAGTLNRTGKFDLKFDCKPQKFLRDGNVVRTIKDGSSITLRNPTKYDAYPLVISKIRDYARNTLMIVDASDSVISRLDFGNDDGRIEYSGSDIIYDSETHEATCQLGGGIVPAKSLVTESFENEYKSFHIPAETEVRIDSWYGEFDIYPRWFRI